MINRRFSLHSALLWTVLFVFSALPADSAENIRLNICSHKSQWSARRQWQPGVGPAVVSVPRIRNGHDAVGFSCPFDRIKERYYWDASVDLDLSSCGSISFWIRLKNPSAFSRCTLYLKSGEGWYGGWFHVKGEKWQRVELHRGDFQPEDSPLGWHQIDRLRFSFWKGRPIATAVGVSEMVAHRADIAVIRGTRTLKKTPLEARSVRRYCGVAYQWLRERGIHAARLDDVDVEHGALKNYKVAIYPYNPDITADEVGQIKEFLQRDGKIVLIYVLPKTLAPAIGLEWKKWQKATYPGQFAAIRFKDNVLPLGPETLRQDSWNITVPTLAGAKIIGHWEDASGINFGIPAATRHRNGVFLGHVLTLVDEEKKSKFLLSLIASLSPQIKKRLTRQIIAASGPLPGDGSWVQEALQTLQISRQNGTVERTIPILKNARDYRKQTLAAHRKSDFSGVLEYSEKARKHLLEAYSAAFKSIKKEFRGLWVHKPQGLTGLSWDEAIKKLRSSGFNAVFPNLLWADIAYFPSDVLPEASDAAGENLLQECLTACHKHGVELHVWKVNWKLQGKNSNFTKKLKKQGRLQVSPSGETRQWLCPTDPRNFKLERDSMLEVVRDYPVDGLHFDYIRYPDKNACYCERCRHKFETYVGQKMGKWPQEVRSGALQEEWADWRCQQITELVKSVSRSAREIRPDIQLSAAVYPQYPDCREAVGQDWMSWLESGYLDFVCPMNYVSNRSHFEELLKQQLKSCPPEATLYPGIGASSRTLSPADVLGQIKVLRENDCPGFMIFQYDRSVADKILPRLSLGATRRE
ncbi:MAG: glycoside hydrolase family 10 protein [Candidatus Brocadiia bacterium]